MAKRNHATTCSGRCRSILHKLKEHYSEFSRQIDYPLYELGPEELLIIKKKLNESGLKDEYDNPKEFINGLKDESGNLIILVFRIKALKYLEVWIDVGYDIAYKYLKYH